MHFIKTFFVMAIGLGSVTYARPVDNKNADSCYDAYRGGYYACERGRDQKHEGRYEERLGQQQIANGNLIGGLGNLINGAFDQYRGSQRECQAGGRCHY